MGRLVNVSVRGQNIQSVQYKNHYNYGEYKPDVRACVCQNKSASMIGLEGKYSRLERLKVV